MKRASRTSNGDRLALLFLAGSIANVGVNTIPPATLAIMSVNLCFHYLGGPGSLVPVTVWWLPSSMYQAKLCPGQVLSELSLYKLPPLLWANFFHVDDWHLAYNMVSLLWKGLLLEPQLGSARLVWLVLQMGVLSSLLHVALAALEPWLLGTYYASSCSVGFSATLFALKVILNYSEDARPVSRPRILGFLLPVELPTKHMAWFELLVTHYAVPQASFTGHLAGILAGLLYAHRAKLARMLRGSSTRSERSGGGAGSENRDLYRPPASSQAGAADRPPPPRPGWMLRGERRPRGVNAARQASGAI
eukprot:g993.t1